MPKQDTATVDTPLDTAELLETLKLRDTAGDARHQPMKREYHIARAVRQIYFKNMWAADGSSKEHPESIRAWLERNGVLIHEEPRAFGKNEFQTKPFPTGA